MATKREKHAAYGKLKGLKVGELFDAVLAAGTAGITFKQLKEKLGINSANMLYARIGELKDGGLIKVTLQGRVATYHADYQPEA